MKIKNYFEYKGYLGSAEIDTENNVLFGKLLFISDLISYQGTSTKSLRHSFEEAVDSYLEMCEELGDEPDQPCKGSFNIRVGPELHRKLNLSARAEGLGLNEYICQALSTAVNKSPKKPPRLGTGLKTQNIPEPHPDRKRFTVRQPRPSR